MPAIRSDHASVERVAQALMNGALPWRLLTLSPSASRVEHVECNACRLNRQERQRPLLLVYENVLP